jgi:hypothetical protein
MVLRDPSNDIGVIGAFPREAMVRETHYEPPS